MQNIAAIILLKVLSSQLGDDYDIPAIPELSDAITDSKIVNHQARYVIDSAHVDAETFCRVGYVASVLPTAIAALSGAGYILLLSINRDDMGKREYGIAQALPLAYSFLGTLCSFITIGPITSTLTTLGALLDSRLVNHRSEDIILRAIPGLIFGFAGPILTVVGLSLAIFNNPQANTGKVLLFAGMYLSLTAGYLTKISLETIE